MEIKRWSIYLVDLKPTIGTKPGKVRPALVIQQDALNEIKHPSTVILPITSRLENKDAYPLRVYLPKKESGLDKDSVILVDQILAWDNRRFIKAVGKLSENKTVEVQEALIEFFGWS